MQWRAILDGEHSASWNMAMDEAVLDAVTGGIAPASLRIFTFDDPAVTVGRHQNVEAGLNTGYCAANFVPIIRRPTGGRGILHGSDLTVSITLPLQSIPSAKSSVIDSYRYLSSGYLLALQDLGIEGGMGDCAFAEGRAGDCFAVTSRADVVVVAGQKLVGSAQRRRGGFLLQQSSIRYRRPDIPPGDVFRGPVEDGAYPLENIPSEALASALLRGFSTVLGSGPEVVPGPTAWEEERAAILLREYPSLTA